MKSTYLVKLDAFEGPMDLLMHLIEKNKIDLYDIPIAELTRQYLAYIDTLYEFDIEFASEFLVMAATLLRIKSRMMLPKTVVDEPDAEDPRMELVMRLLEYRRFKEVTPTLYLMADTQNAYVERAPMPLPIHRLAPENLSADSLMKIFCTLQRMNEEAAIPTMVIASEEYRVQDKMSDILSLLEKRHGTIGLRDAFPTGTRGELLAAFLALLELIKMQVVVVSQDHLYHDIQIEMKEGIRGVS
ncbi:ScpA family protein [Selenomonas sp. F0473]|uniref:segregation and condensation protein A n=1 Tax=Selenomonas sp. F0473 TaxID=999423 RepID=UPI0003022EB3|nr:segregation/condensation protein A [Selenomonas sp. F0473]